MGSGGGGGSWNPFEGVSWNKPFGDSAASNLVGGAGGISSIGQGVSWNKPFGDTSSLGLALYGNSQAPLTSTGKDKQTGEQVIVPGTQNMVDANGNPIQSPQFGGGFVYNGSSAVSGGGKASPSPRSALALEERLRAGKRANLTPNVEFSYNLEKNPIASSAVRPMGGRKF